MRNPPYKPQAKEIRCLGWIRGDHGWTYSAHISRNWAFQSRPYLLLERIKRWNYLENILIKFQIEDKRYTGLNYKPPFLESSYLLGQLIYRNNLLPPDSIKEMTIFERTTLLRMIEYHVELLFSRGKGDNWQCFQTLPSAHQGILITNKVSRGYQMI
ncbi:hypothetical protein MJO28_009043 [Puccinia striiformis f. sp. tritici]|uniref:Uncharacterized protein n=1 Tax=Puccinia striiformis f. sp. tritici TaxID=168172 RepID=A0ACC0ECC1_9BASI|nr:hypothetical protein MJO28_009043 [Puccinia striiformis f. sp. tritici]